MEIFIKSNVRMNLSS